MKNVDVNTKDYSYQYDFPDYPEVPRPLLAAAWETNSFDTVDVLMDMKPDTRVLYTNRKESECPPKPLFFQVCFYSSDILTFGFSNHLNYNV